MEKIKKWLRKVDARVGVCMLTAATMLAGVASAAADTPDTPLAIIEAATNSLKSDAAKVIAGALGIGVIFFGARLLWTKFKGMAK